MIDETVVSGHHRDLGYYSLERGGNLKGSLCFLSLWSLKISFFMDHHFFLMLSKLHVHYTKNHFTEEWSEFAYLFPKKGKI